MFDRLTDDGVGCVALFAAFHPVLLKEVRGEARGIYNKVKETTAYLMNRMHVQEDNP